jgi:hypothetical protein
MLVFSVLICMWLRKLSSSASAALCYRDNELSFTLQLLFFHPTTLDLVPTKPYSFPSEASLFSRQPYYQWSGGNALAPFTFGENPLIALTLNNKRIIPLFSVYTTIKNPKTP